MAGLSLWFVELHYDELFVLSNNNDIEYFVRNISTKNKLLI